MRYRMQQILCGALLAALLTATFLAYFQPSFVLDLANRLIMCL